MNYDKLSEESLKEMKTQIEKAIKDKQISKEQEIVNYINENINYTLIDYEKFAYIDKKRDLIYVNLPSVNKEWTLAVWNIIIKTIYHFKGKHSIYPVHNIDYQHNRQYLRIRL